MATFLQRDAELWVSILPEVAFNTGYTLAAEFQKMATNAPIVLLPNYDFTNDAGKPGNGNEFATFQCLKNVQHPAFSFSEEINPEMPGRLMLRALGGTVTPTLLAGTAYKHVAGMLPVASGRQLPSSTVITKLAAADVIWPGVVVDRFKMSQNRADTPIWEADMVGSGKFATPNGVASLPASATGIACLDGNSSLVQWTDAGGLRDFTLNDGYRNWSIEVVNNSKLNDRLAGDPTLSLTYETVTVTPSHVRRILRGDRVINASITIPLNSTKVEWEKYTIGQQLTDVIFAGRGAVISGAHRYMMQFTIPKARIASIIPGEDDGDAVITINLLPFWDTVSGSALIAQVNNTTTTNFK